MENNQNVINPYLFPGMELSKLDKTKYSGLKNVPINEEDIIEMVAKEFNITKEEIISRSRKRIYVESRQIISYVLKTKYKITLASIGEYVGGRDHTSIIHYLQTFSNIYETDSRYRNKCKNILTNVGLNPENV